MGNCWLDKCGNGVQGERDKIYADEMYINVIICDDESAMMSVDLSVLMCYVGNCWK